MPVRKTFAQKVRHHRLRQGKSQTVIAGLAGLNPEYLGQIERGRRTPSLDTVESIASALSVPIQELLTESENRGTTTADSRLATELHRALHIGTPTPHEEPPGPVHLREEIDRAWNIWQGTPDRYTRISPLIASLATGVVHHCAGPTGMKAPELAADTYALLRTVARRINRPELALLAADRGIQAATHTQDPARLATARWNMAHALLALGEYSTAKEVALHAISATKPHTGRDTHAVTGALWLTAAVAQARSGDSYTALEWINDRAAPLAESTGETNTGRTCFGPANVALHAISIELEGGQAASALNVADRLDVSPLASRERHTTWALDLARAHVLRSDPGTAMLYLLQAEQSGAEDLRYGPQAHETMRLVLRRARPAIRSQLTQLAGRLGAEESVLRN